MLWSYGITTVPSRIDSTFPRTLSSLSAAGFDKPTLFVDGTFQPNTYKEFGQHVSVRYPLLKTFGNWWLAAWELYIRVPNADRYAIFQDDIVCVKNLKKYLEKVPYPKDGYLNLYTFPQNQEIARANNYNGFFQSNQRGLGAVATVYTRDALLTLFKSHHMIDRPMTAGRRAYSAVDGGIVTSMNKAGWKEYCHNPSLVQHIGEQSSMGNRKHPQAPSFPGEEFDAMELLKGPLPANAQMSIVKPKISPSIPTVTTNRELDGNVYTALAIMGLDPTPVEQWYVKQCKCEDKPNKKQMIESWAVRILQGKIKQAKPLLKELMTCCEDH